VFHQRLKGMNDAGVGVIEVERSAISSMDIKWSKKRTDTIEVTLDPSLKDKLTLHHPASASGDVTVQRRSADRLGVDLAVIDTDLFSSTFEAKDKDGK